MAQDPPGASSRARSARTHRVTYLLFWPVLRVLVLVLAHFAMAAAGRSACERSRILATPVHTCTTKPLHARRLGPFRATQNQKSTLLPHLQASTTPLLPAHFLLSRVCPNTRVRVSSKHVTSVVVPQQYASICSIFAWYMRCTVCRVMLSDQQLCSPAFGGFTRIHAAATATRTRAALCGLRGSARGHPSLCTSVSSVIGLFLAEPKERMEMEKTADATPMPIR
eukprot:scaffold2906_cov129-Isochrysis_galbana.AAC.2